MSLKHEGIIEMTDMKRTNEKVIAAIRATGHGDDYYGRKLIEEYQDGIREIDAELIRRQTGKGDQ